MGTYVHDRRRNVFDALFAGALLIGTAVYLEAMPQNLNPADEAIHLYDAKRILQGEVPYRDYFTFITPGYMYVMAGLFFIFGTTIETARLATAVLHGANVALIYATCRRLGVRPGLAWPAALAYPLVCQPAWPIASQHWLSTFLCVLALFICSGVRQRSRGLVAAGIVLGLLVGVQQHRGAFMAAGVFAWILLDRAVERRFRPVSGPVLAPVARLAGGVLIVAAPLSLAIIAAAGLEPVWADLVVFPLSTYRPKFKSEWGHVVPLLAWQGSFTFPGFLKALPAVLPVALGRLVVLLVSRRDEVEARRLTLLIAFCIASVLSIAYYPDFIHIAFIAPAFLVTIAHCVEWPVRLLPTGGPLRAAAALAAVAFLVLSGARLYRNFWRAWEAHPHSRTTAFGRIDFANPVEIELYDTLRELMRTAPSRYLYCYPIVSHLYLMVDATNPTPYGFFFTAFNGIEQAADVIRNLSAKQPPYIVFLDPFVAADDPVALWIREHYSPLGDEGVTAAIYRKKERGPNGG